MRFLLGVHRPGWLEDVPSHVALFVSRRTFLDEAGALRRRLPVARGSWALDSGGFTELSRLGRWSIGEDRYVDDVRRIAEEVGSLSWVAPMDWMVEPEMLAGSARLGWPGTGLTVEEHQRRTVENFLLLRDALGPLVVPVLQGWEIDDYHRCVERYARAGVELDREPLVGVGSVCRRQDTGTAARVFRGLAELRLALHGFGVKTSGLEVYGTALESADSMAWSFDAKMDGLHRKTFADARGLPRDHPMRFGPCGKRSCANCLHRALEWRDALLERIERRTLQLRLEVGT